MVETAERPPAAVDAEERVTPSSKDLVPATGYRNYWYPAIESRKVGARPVAVTLLGERIAVFRDSRDGRVYALHDRCPHKGLPLSCARAYFPGTITCAYHGWTYNGQGTCVAAICEGPDSQVPGRVHVRSYPAEERWGVVWVFVGETEHPPLDEDVPIEHFRKPVRLLNVQEWQHNWRDGMENTADTTHAQVLHRHAPFMWFTKMPVWAKAGAVETARGNGVGIYYKQVGGYEAEFPGVGKLSNNPWWKYRTLGRRVAYDFSKVERGEVEGVVFPNEVRLPCWRIIDIHPVAFLEATVPIDAHSTRMFSFTFRDLTGIRALLFKLHYYLYLQWFHDRLFLGEDRWAMERLTPGPERFYGNDVGVLAWRKLSRKARGAGHAPVAAGEEASE
jgi:nitrite reductase/ring-hydroxylating ferredoxin subunit